ncbi:hypothetical protein N7449_009730 [Penicillium cf. viridicatum]|uniref:Uncharacterized protein n=1 Tax=Penicillium cf. viridicatum TaxID=2972119 RepID=A0A9W9JAN0_9EURO|nr:hypothetical protein N7449_009730 [Penicillium cf. viridicatum]
MWFFIKTIYASYLYGKAYYPKATPELVVGLVVAPPCVETDKNLNTDLARYDLHPGMGPERPEDIWEFGYNNFKVRLNGTCSWERKCLALSG